MHTVPSWSTASSRTVRQMVLWAMAWLPAAKKKAKKEEMPVYRASHQLHFSESDKDIK